MKDSPSRRTPWEILLGFWRRIQRPQPPTDPYADRLVPVRRGPSGRSGAAVAEPENYSFNSYPLRKQ